MRSPMPKTARLVDTAVVSDADGGPTRVAVSLYMGETSAGARSGYERRPTAWLRAQVLSIQPGKPVTWRFGGRRFGLARQAFRDLLANLNRPDAEKRPFDYRTGLVA